MFRRWDVVGFVLLAASVYVLMPLSDAIVLGVVTAYGLRVLVDRLSRFMDREVVEYALLTGVAVVTTAGLYLLVANVSTVTVELIQLTQTMISNIQVLLEPYDVASLSAYVSQSLSAASAYLRGWLFGLAASLPWVVLELVTYLLVVYYMYRNWGVIMEDVDEVINRLPDEEADTIRRVRGSVSDLVGNVFVVYGTFAVIMTVVGSVGFYVIGELVTGAPIPFFWAWGIAVGFAAFVEGLGAFVFTGPLIVYYFVVGQTWLAFWLLIFQIVFLSIFPSILLPYLGAERLKESFFVMMLGLLAGPMVFGLKGVVLGPVFIITVKDLVLSRFE